MSIMRFMAGSRLLVLGVEQYEHTTNRMVNWHFCHALPAGGSGGCFMQELS